MGSNIEVHWDRGKKCELTLEPIGDGHWLALFRSDGNSQVASTTQQSRAGALEWGDFILSTVFPQHCCGDECVLIPRPPAVSVS